MAEIGRINVNDLIKTITVRVTITGHKTLWVKMCIGTFLIRLGIWIIGMKGEVGIKE